MKEQLESVVLQMYRAGARCSEANSEQSALRNALETLSTLRELAERDISEWKKPV
jgi:hypothetical protein